MCEYSLNRRARRRSENATHFLILLFSHILRIPSFLPIYHDELEKLPPQPSEIPFFLSFFVRGPTVCMYVLTFFSGEKKCASTGIINLRGVIMGHILTGVWQHLMPFSNIFFAPLRVREKLSRQKKLKQVFVCLFCCIFSRLLPPSSFFAGCLHNFPLLHPVANRHLWRDLLWMCVVASMCVFFLKKIYELLGKHKCI